jgi:putative transposase
MNRLARYPLKMRERAVRLVFEHQDECDSRVGGHHFRCDEVGHDPETLRKWVRRVEIDEGQRPGLTPSERERLKELEKENKELRRANEILKAAAASFGAQARPPTEEMTVFIDDRKDEFGVEPMCEVLPLAPSTYYARKSRPPSARDLADAELEKEIRRIYDANYQVYGVRKVWKQLAREPIWSTGSSRCPLPTACGWPISPMGAPRRA